MKGHFKNRLRRLRLDILLQDGISDATRAALTGRLDAALERWKSPRFATLFFTVLLPGVVVSVPTWNRHPAQDVTARFLRHVDWLPRPPTGPIVPAPSMTAPAIASNVNGPSACIGNLFFVLWPADAWIRIALS